MTVKQKSGMNWPTAAIVISLISVIAGGLITIFQPIAGSSKPDNPRDSKGKSVSLEVLEERVGNLNDKMEKYHKLLREDIKSLDKKFDSIILMNKGIK